MRDRDRLPIWTVYDHPRDYPTHFVARKFLSLPKPEPTGEVIADTDLNRLRGVLTQWGLTCLQRMPGDDPVILETWL